MLKLLGLFGTIATLGMLVGATRAQANPYNACTVDLNNAKLDSALITAGCGQALHPDHLGTCVARIVDVKENPIAAIDALDHCRRVRRPLELATCVNEIRASDAQAPAKDVLSACQQSLLPERFGRCVVGFRNKPLEKPIAQGLTSCLDAMDYRKDIQLRPLSDLLGSYETTSPKPVFTMPSPSSPMPPATPGANVIPQTY